MREVNDILEEIKKALATPYNHRDEMVLIPSESTNELTEVVELLQAERDEMEKRWKMAREYLLDSSIALIDDAVSKHCTSGGRQ